MKFFFFLSILLGCFAPCYINAQTSLSRDTVKARSLLDAAKNQNSKGQLLSCLGSVRQARQLYQQHQLKEEVMRNFMLEIRYFSNYRRWDSTFVTIEKAEAYFAQQWPKQNNNLSLNLGLSKAGTLINTGQDEAGISLLDSLDEILTRQKIKMTGEEEGYLFRRYYFRAYAYLHKNEYKTAQLYAQRAMDICQNLKADYSDSESSIYYLLLDIYSFTEEYTKIKKSLTPFLEKMISRFGQESRQTAEAYKNVAFGAYILKDYALSSTYYNQSEAIYKDLIAKGCGDCQVALNRLYVNMGIGYKDSYYHVPEEIKKGQLQKAETALKAGMAGLTQLNERESSQFGNAARALGFVYYEQEQYKEALQYFQLSVRSQINGVKFEEGNDNFLPDFNDPRLVYQNYFVLFWNIDSKNVAYWAMYERDPQDKYLEAICSASKAMETLFERNFTQVVDASDQMLMLEQKIVIYNRWIKALYKLYEKNKDPKFAWEAFKIAEKSKASLLFSSLRNAQNALDNNVPKALQEEEKALRQKMANNQKYLADASRSDNKELVAQLQDSVISYNKSFERLLLQLKTNYPNYYQWKYQRQIDTWQPEAISSKLADENKMLIEYFVQEDKLYIFSLHAKNWQFIQVDIRRDSLQKNVRALHSALSDNSTLVSTPDIAYANYTKNAFLLYQQLIAPINIPKSVKKLVIIPDNCLHYIPFETFLTQAAPPSVVHYNRLAYLLRDYTIHYHYTVELLLLQGTKAANKSGKIAAFAAEYYLKSDSTKQIKDSVLLKNRSGYAQQLRSVLSPLPNAIEEVKFLKSQYKGDFFIGKAANEQQFKSVLAGDYSVLHLAMHGLVNEKNPSESSLAFTEDFAAVEDNFLYAFEIKQQQIASELVVLSACETGCGKYSGGEGVISLARSFMYAGTRNIVMTLWAINDQTTASIMILFYAKLHSGLAIDDALQQAKLQYLSEMNQSLAAHPMFWAPFVHIGQSTSVAVSSVNDRDYWLWLGIGAGLLALLAFGFFLWRRRTAARLYEKKTARPLLSLSLRLF
jgi:CHAT domain-containing protein